MTDDAGEPMIAYREPEAWLGFLLNQLGGIVRERTYTALGRHGLAPRAMGFMLVLHERPGSSQTAVFRRLGTDRTTMSQLVDQLVRQGLVDRTADPVDRRNNRLDLTDQGRHCLSEATAQALAVERELTVSLDPAAVESLRTQLAAWLKALREGQP